MTDRTPAGPGLEHLAVAAGKITSQLELEKVREQIVLTLSDDLGAAFAALWVAEYCGERHGITHPEDSTCLPDSLRLAAWHGLSEISGVPDCTIPDDPALGGIACDMSPLIHDRPGELPSIADPNWLKSNDIRSFAGFPLVRGGRLLGIIAYYGRSPIDDNLRLMLMLLAHHCAIALDNACQHRRIMASERRLQALMDGAIDSVFILGVNGRILTTSRSACRNLRYNPDEFANIGFMDLDPDSYEHLRDAFPELLAGGTATYNGSFITGSGGRLPVEVRAGAAVYDGDTVIQAYVRDVSERIDQQRQKADLVSMITHDLKGPLTVMMGYSEIILEQYADGLDEFVKEGLHAIQTGGIKLRGMIEDYLSLSKLESGSQRLNRAPLKVTDLVERAVNTMRFSAKLKKQRMEVSIPDCVKTVYVDGRLMDRAITNLLVNAVNYTPFEGLITVTCSASQDKRFAHISVADNGVGIPADEIDMVFDKFYRSTTGGGKGTGLGLAIVKSVAEAHGGSVTVESVEGKGSRFTLCIPLGRGE